MAYSIVTVTWDYVFCHTHTHTHTQHTHTHTGACCAMFQYARQPGTAPPFPTLPHATTSCKGHLPSGTAISSARALDQALQDIGDWDALCTNLGVRTATMSALRYEHYAVPTKKTHCLTAFHNCDVEEGTEVNWESVVRTVQEYPISNKRVAKKIAQDHLEKHDEL